LGTEKRRREAIRRHIRRGNHQVLAVSPAPALQQPQAEDYVIATGKTHSVQELLEVAFSHAGLDWKKYVEIDPLYYRPAEVDLLIGNPSCQRFKRRPTHPRRQAVGSDVPN